MGNEIMTTGAGSVKALSSMEVAKMIQKRHMDLMRDIRRYTGHMQSSGERKIASADFWLESSYTDRQGKQRPCYLITKKGCEFISHKLTGVKGTQFTVQYINRFHEMEQELSVQARPTQISAEKYKALDEKVDEIAEKLDKALSCIDHIQEEDSQKIEEYAENPFYNTGKTEDNLENINAWLDELCSLCHMSRNKILHYLYIAMEEEYGIYMNSYRNVFKDRLGTSSNLHYIAKIPKLYHIARKLFTGAIEDNRRPME